MRNTTPLLMVATLVAAWCVLPQSVRAMSNYKWKKRPLLVFAADASSDLLKRQRSIAESAAAGFAERDMVVVFVIGDRVEARPGPGPGLTADALRTRYGVPKRGFRAILVGKDGGAKLSASQPIAARSLFATIDAMPMRQQEMSRR